MVLIIVPWKETIQGLQREFSDFTLRYSAHITYRRFAVPDLLNKLQGNDIRHPRALIAYILQSFRYSAHLAAPYFPVPQYRFCKGVDSASNRNEYQEYFLGVKAACA
jgi:hypothetical protein